MSSASSRASNTVARFAALVRFGVGAKMTPDNSAVASWALPKHRPRSPATVDTSIYPPVRITRARSASRASSIAGDEMRKGNWVRAPVESISSSRFLSHWTRPSKSRPARNIRVPFPRTEPCAALETEVSDSWRTRLCFQNPLPSEAVLAATYYDAHNMMTERRAFKSAP